MVEAIFFDLDGTFADTAPDLNFAVNQMRQTRGLQPLPLAATRPVTSLGARGLLNKGFDITPEHPQYRAMREEFLAVYEDNICRESSLFPGMAELVDSIEARGLPWGIVTNKVEFLARLLLAKLGMAARTRCIIGGDTTAHLKPHPEPLLAACRAVGVDASSCIYVGDDRRDVDAGHAAGMRTAVAKWGYLNGGNPETWGGDWMLENPQNLLRNFG
ncbi:MAG TPA: phosphoglycolate phosphatase [Burkholderiales bacterium]|nr:phosphoglycolate phosphatase [Burkholderiales bacterium]